jgi:hypothetical protein
LGTTPAYVIENGGAAFYFPLEIVCSPETADRMMVSWSSIPAVIPSNNPPIKVQTFFLLPTDDHIDEIISEIRTDRLFAGIRGFLKYRDAFDLDRELRFRYVWKYSPWKETIC